MTKLVSRNKTLKRVGGGLVNSIINNLPVELHIPGYSYCGPGTRLHKRLKRGDPGINNLDKACKAHDIAYSKTKQVKDRHIADNILKEEAWKSAISNDSNIAVRISALAVANLMAAKVKLGMGMACNKAVSKNRKPVVKKQKAGLIMGKAVLKKRGAGLIKKKAVPKKRKPVRNVRTPVKPSPTPPAPPSPPPPQSATSPSTLSSAVLNAKNALKLTKSANIKDAIKVALKAAAKGIIKSRNKHIITKPRIIPVPKTGGVLPFLIPIFAGLSAVGALSGGVAGIARAVSKASEAAKALDESKRHNRTMESIAMGKGLYLKPYRTGMGLYLSPKNH